MLTNELKSVRPLFVRGIAAAAFVVCVSGATVYAQDAVATDAPKTATEPLLANLNKPIDLASAAGVTYSSSSSSSEEATADSTLNFTGAGTDALQPPPRRRYGRPRYNDSSHNPDGSNKYAFIAGVGATIPNQDTSIYLNTSYGFQVGAGRNFNKNFSVIAQFDYDHFGFTGQTLNNQATLYGAQGQGLDGTSHVWSFSVNPAFNFYSSEGLGAYVIGGVGFYHKTANFTVPATGTYCDPYYGCYQYSANQTIDKYTSNAPGFSGGLGMTFKPSRFANEKLYVEARYVYVDNAARFGLTTGNVNTPAGLTYTGNNYFPANSHHTSYVPIKVGVRF